MKKVIQVIACAPVSEGEALHPGRQGQGGTLMFPSQGMVAENPAISQPYSGSWRLCLVDSGSRAADTVKFGRLRIMSILPESTWALGYKKTISKLIHKPVVAGLLLGLLVFAATAMVRQTGALQPLELEAYDLLLRTHQGSAAIAPRVVQIAITEADIQRLGRWPLPDTVFSDMIEAMQAYQPDAVGVDIYRDLKVGPGRARLNELLAAYDSIVMVEKIGTGDRTGVPAPDVLQGTDRVGFSDLLVDPDGVVRRGLLFLDDGEQVYYSMALRLVLRYLQLRGVYPQAGEPDPSWLRLGDVSLRPLEGNDGSYVGADARGYQFMLDYHGGPQPFPVYTLGDLLAREIPGDALRDKVVVLGVAAESVKDDFLTPFRHSGHDVPGIPGYTLHAQAVGQLLRMALDGDRPLNVISDSLEYLWILFWTAAGIGIVLLLKTAGKLIPAVMAGTALLVMGSWVAFGNNLWLPLVPAGICWMAGMGLMVAFLTSHENAQRRQVMELFARQVSEDVAKDIWKQRDDFMEGGRVPAREVVCTVLFSDLENFTPVSESLGAAKLMDWLNRYMDIMAGLVLEHGGIVDDYFGDAIMADFGVPIERTSEAEYEQDARNAVDCALAMRAAIADLNIKNAEQGLPPVRMRAGIATGEMVVGFLGTSQRMKYTTIGDTVNTAARLESYGKELPPMAPAEGACRILVAGSTARRLGDSYRIESVGMLELKGKSAAVEVFKILSKEV